MPEYTRNVAKFVTRGVNLSVPPDALPAGDYLNLTNCRPTEQGGLVSRPGQMTLHGTPTPQTNQHSIRRLNNPYPGAAVPYARILGAGTKIYTQIGGANPVERDLGYSGNPLSLVRFRPDQSPESWMYVGDSTKMSKINTAGTVKGVGIHAPMSSPVIELVTDQYLLLALFDAASIGGWANTGTAGGPANSNRVSTTIAKILYDSGTTGWATVQPTTTDNAWLEPGVIVHFTNAALQNESPIVQEVHNPITTTTIAAILYDSGTTGACSIQLATATQVIARNSLVTLSAGAETVRVLSVTLGPDGLYSMRCSTTGAHAAGETVTGLASFRARLNFTYVAGNTLVADEGDIAITAGTGIITEIVTVDLSVYNTLAPLSNDDYMHLSFGADVIANVTGVRLLLDVDAATNDFTQNYYFQTFSAADFSVAGNAGWAELIFNVGQLTRIGTDVTRTLANVKAIRIEFTVSANTTVKVSSWWIRGGYGPDVTPGAPVGIFYRYRYRDSTTGAKSIPGPTTRYDLFPLRQEIGVTVAASADPAVDSIDIERLDPSLQAPAPAPAQFTYVGTLPNAAGTYLDSLVASEIAANPALETNVFKPFPVLAKPLSGIVSVAGTTVSWVSGDIFPARLVPGTVILLDQVAYQVYSVRSSTQLEIVSSGGAGANVSFSIDSPVIPGTPLPVIFGPLEGPTASFVFGLGDPNNPGTLYWCNGNDPDSASDLNSIEISPPSEPLVGGVVWQTYVFVGTRDRLWLIQPSFDQPNPFTPLQIPAAAGFWSPYGVTAGIDGVYYWGRDGMYLATPYYGGQNIGKDLWPLFPHEGVPGKATAGFLVPDMNVATQLRVSVDDAQVYFHYQDSGGTLRTWVSVPGASTSTGTLSSPRVTPTAIRQDTSSFGWIFYTYAHPVALHYFEEVAPGTVPQMLELTREGLLLAAANSPLLDVATAITCTAQMGYQNFGDTRASKLIGDHMVAANGGGGANTGFSVTVLGNFGQITLVAATTVGSAGTQRTNYLLDTSSGIGKLATNASITVSWQPIGFLQELFEWQCSFVPKPPDTALEATDWTDDGRAGAKYVRFLIIEADTTNAVTGAEATRTVQVQYDRENDGTPTLGATLTIAHNGQSEQAYAISAPFVAHELRVLPTDASQWRLFKIRWGWDAYPELAPIITAWSDDGSVSAKFLQGMVLPADTGNAPVSILLQGDGESTITSLSVTHNGQEEKAYSWAPPIITHMMRIVPSGDIRIWEEKIRWVWEPSPELALFWITQALQFSSKGGFACLRDGLIHHQSTADLTLTITAQIIPGTNIDYVYTIPHSSGFPKRSYLNTHPIKGRLLTFAVTSCDPFRLFKQSTVFRVKEWAANQYTPVPPFGEMYALSGARI